MRMDTNSLVLAMARGNFSLILVPEISRVINEPRKDKQCLLNTVIIIVIIIIVAIVIIITIIIIAGTLLTH